jgi:hypothetical protein
VDHAMMTDLEISRTDGKLRWVAESHDRAQTNRVRIGEQIRAIVQGRDQSWGFKGEDRDGDEVLKEIRKGTDEGPVPILGLAYRRYLAEEREMAKLLEELLISHPAWPWLEEVRGVGALLAGKLLARLDIHRARTPSAFWAYCGLATVPGVEHRCETCGLVVASPERSTITGQHKALNSGRRCTGVLERSSRSGVRIAQARIAGEKSSFDITAKKLCYLAGVSFLRVGGAYEKFYRRERRKLDVQRPGWVDKRKHLTALRKTQKLFLSNPWQVWREGEGLPVTTPYQGLAGDFHPISPWRMTGDG